MIPPPPENIAVLLQRPVAVLGGGVSGQGVLLLLEKIGATGRLYDEKSAEAAPQFTNAHASGHGLVVFSPGFAPEHPWLETARAAGCVCLGELDFGALFWRGEVIAITGTNGKTTLTELLTHALTQAGRRAHIAGNIGYSFCRLVVEQSDLVDIAVCEVSSFQAETLQYFRPKVTFWINFAEDHLERHQELAAYFRAKWRLIEQTAPEAIFVGSSVQRYAARHRAILPKGALVATEHQPADPQLAGTIFETYPQQENFLLAAAWWRRVGWPIEKLYEAARTFQPGQHRLTKVREKDGVEFWNDSKATNFHAVEAALSTFARPVLWIGGGRGKGGDLAAFVERISSRIRHAFLLGETQAILAGLLRDRHVPLHSCGSLEEAVRSAFGRAESGDVILLSPGFASFDMFKGYDDRGRQFEHLVQNL